MNRSELSQYILETHPAEARLFPGLPHEQNQLDHRRTGRRVPDEKIKMLVELSYQATAPKPRRSKGTKA